MSNPFSGSRKCHGLFNFSFLVLENGIKHEHDKFNINYKILIRANHRQINFLRAIGFQGSDLFREMKNYGNSVVAQFKVRRDRLRLLATVESVNQSTMAMYIHQSIWLHRKMGDPLRTTDLHNAFFFLLRLQWREGFFSKFQWWRLRWRGNWKRKKNVWNLWVIIIIDKNIIERKIESVCMQYSPRLFSTKS